MNDLLALRSDLKDMLAPNTRPYPGYYSSIQKMIRDIDILLKKIVIKKRCSALDECKLTYFFAVK